MKLIKIITRSELIRLYVEQDAKKKKLTIPSDFRTVSDDANAWDDWLSRNHFKHGAMSAFKQWAYAELSLDDLMNSAIYSGVFNAGDQNLADLIQSGKIRDWKPDRATAWYSNLSNGDEFGEDLAIIMRPAVPGEKSKWYIEDGSGRAVCYLQRLFKFREPCKAFAYVGFEVDATSNWIKNLDNGFFIKNSANYDVVNKVI